MAEEYFREEVLNSVTSECSTEIYLVWQASLLTNSSRKIINAKALVISRTPPYYTVLIQWF